MHCGHEHGGSDQHAQPYAELREPHPLGLELVGKQNEEVVLHRLLAQVLLDLGDEDVDPDGARALLRGHVETERPKRLKVWQMVQT